MSQQREAVVEGSRPPGEVPVTIIRPSRGWILLNLHERLW